MSTRRHLEQTGPISAPSSFRARLLFPTALAVGIFALLAAPRAWCDSTPVVHAVPETPLTARRALAAKKKAVPAPLPDKLTLDGAPPASVPFYFEVPVVDGTTTGGRVKVWPRAEQATQNSCDAGPPAGASQSYELGMVPVKEDSVTYLRANVPALQVGQTFCFSVTVQFVLTAADMGDLEVTAGNAIRARILTPPNSCAMNDADFSAILRSAFATEQLVATDTGLAAHFIANAFQPFLNDCTNLQIWTDQLSDTREHLKKLTASVDKLMDTRSLSPLGPLPSPRLTIANQPVEASSIATATAKSDDLRSGEAQLRARANDADYPGPDRAILTEWADALKKLGAAVVMDTKDPKRKAAIKDGLASVKAAGAHRLSIAEVAKDQSAGVYKLCDVLIGPRAGGVLDPDAVVSDLGWLASHLSPREAPALKDWKTTFTSIWKAVKERNAAQDSESKLMKQANDADTAFKADLVKVFADDRARSAAVLAAEPFGIAGVAGSGTTPSAANFASVDAGGLLGFPSGGTSGTTWLVPYIGLNLYATPVDRTISLGQLTGGGWQQVRQRVSLTLGMTLSQPSLNGRTVSAPFAGHYPIIAAGIRLTHFTRITGGAILYNVADLNPASGASKLMAAPFVGVALDIDVIHLLTQAKL
jgi:hypothetical protein